MPKPHRRTGGLKTALRLLAAAASIAVTLTASAAQTWDLPALMRALSAAPQGETRFTERKTIALLTEPLLLSGSLLYRPPARLEKHITAPFDERYAVDGDRLTIDNPAKQLHQSLSLAAYPALWAFVESIRAPLAGDLQTLQRFYKLSLGGTQRNWLLALQPIEPDMARLVRLIKIKGRAGQMTEIDIEEANGDRSVMSIEQAR